MQSLQEITDEIDEWFADNTMLKSKSMVKREDVLKIILDCIESERGAVPESFYGMFEVEELNGR